MGTLIALLWLLTMPLRSPDQPLDGVDNAARLLGATPAQADWIQDVSYDALHASGWEAP